MGTINPQVISLTGLAPTFAAVAAGGDEVTNDGNVYVEIVNSHASNSYTVTATTPADVDGVAIEKAESAEVGAVQAVDVQQCEWAGGAELCGDGSGDGPDHRGVQGGLANDERRATNYE